MKKLFLIIVFALGCQLASTAQITPPTDFMAVAMAATQQLAAVVILDDARLLPVRHLTQARLAQEEEMRQLYANDPAMLQNKLRVIGQEYTTQLSALLTAAQYQRYLAAAPGTLPAMLAPMLLPKRASIANAQKSRSVPKKVSSTASRSLSASRQAKL